MYLGCLLGVFGMALRILSLILLLVSGVFFFVIFRNRMQEEERLLSAVFEESYNTCMKRTMRLIHRVYELIHEKKSDNQVDTKS